MNTDPIREKFTRWSLERVQFLLSHLEDFIEGDEKTIQERSRTFVAASGLETIEKLVDCEPSDPKLPLLLLDRLAAFFDSGLLIQQSPSPETGNWWATDLFWRGQVFHLELKDQIQANHVIPDLPPLNVQKAPAIKILSTLRLDFLCTRDDAEAYLIKPVPGLAYILTSHLAPPWSVDHLTEAQRLINKSFVY